MATLTHQQAKHFYDRFGARQDSQGFYENAAVEVLLTHAALGDARAVCEFGCGTGRVAADLLTRHLPADATYLGLDISDTMIRLASERLASFGERARVLHVDGAPALPVADDSLDRVISTFVTDLLSREDILGLLAEAHRALRPGGLFCNAGLTEGRGPGSRLVMGAWRRVNEWRPQLLGGCRPLRIADFLQPDLWELEHHETVCRFGICSEVTVAAARALAKGAGG